MANPAVFAETSARAEHERPMLYQACSVQLHFPSLDEQLHAEIVLSGNKWQR